MSKLFDYRRLRAERLFILLAILTFGIFAPQNLSAHQQPTTIALLDVKTDRVAMELQIPLSELELAFGHEAAENPQALIEKWRLPLESYIREHIRPQSGEQFWSIEVGEMKIADAEQTQSGAYQEITVFLNLIPPPNVETRKFTLNYDLIMHQVVTHFALVSIRNDWESGIVGEHPVSAGVIGVDRQTTQIFPLEINLGEGSRLKGFKKMLSLGMQHIKQGTDHLLFLLTLLLPATLLVNGKQWGNFGGTEYSIKRLLKIVIAFTVGHSITLIVGALNLLNLPQQPIEILIAVSILVSALHAVRPIFPGKEIYVAAGFGLVHGLAFATVLANLNLGTTQLALSILGFNVGIELMQLLVIALTVPWLILLSQTPVYKWIRISGAVFAAVAAVGWIVERVSGTTNLIGASIQNISQYASICILVLAFIALLTFGLHSIKNKNFSIRTN